MNTIPQKQSTKQSLDRLAAQRQLYSKAKAIFAVQVILAVPCVMMLSLLIIRIPKLAYVAATWGIVVALLDIGVFTPWQRSLKKKAAKIQELFDCDVLNMDWPEIKAGSRPDAETVAEYSSKYRHSDPEGTNLKNWYPPNVGKLPIGLARIVCQRSNCWWDAKQRRRYAIFVITAICTLAIMISGIGSIGDLTFKKLVLAIIAPLMPAFVLGLRQYDEHSETVKVLQKLKEHAEALWSKAIEDKVSSVELTNSSRQLQDEIYEYRCKSPLVFDWIFKLLRSAYQEQMNEGAEVLVEEALQRLKM